MEKPVCVADYEKFAKEKFSLSRWDYISGGGMLEQTLQDNCTAFKRYRLRPRNLVDVSDVDTSTTILGHTLPTPICAASTALYGLTDDLTRECGPIAIAKAAERGKCGYCMSTWSTCSMKDVQEAAPTTFKIMQVYLTKDKSLTERFVKRAEKLCFSALYVNVDIPAYSKRYRELRHNYPLSEDCPCVGLMGEIIQHYPNGSELDYNKNIMNSSMIPEDIRWLRSITKLPVILKGIVTAEMAKKALSCGVDGIIVSNHGGRQLDGVPATIDALPEVVEAVEGKCEVYLDGGVRTGTDVLKAIALGARAVFVGRPLIWGLAYKGSAGVEEVFNILKGEFKQSMQLMGCTSIAELQSGENLVVHQSYYHKSLL